MTDEDEDDFLVDHMAGKHQPEIAELLSAIEPALHGHKRIIVFIALTRMMAAMLAPSPNREKMLDAAQTSIRLIFKEMDRMMGEATRL